MYFVLALRSAFRNELSYGAKTPIDTVCITPVCNDRCLRVYAPSSLSLSLPLSLSLSCTRTYAAFHEETACAPFHLYGHTRVFNLVRGSSVVTECHRAITIRPSCRVSHQFATPCSFPRRRDRGSIGFRESRSRSKRDYIRYAYTIERI